MHLGAATIGIQYPRGLLYPPKTTHGKHRLGHYALDGPSTDEILFSFRCSALAVAMQPEIFSSAHALGFVLLYTFCFEYIRSLGGHWGLGGFSLFFTHHHVCCGSILRRCIQFGVGFGAVVTWRYLLGQAKQTCFKRDRLASSFMQAMHMHADFGRITSAQVLSNKIMGSTALWPNLVAHHDIYLSTPKTAAQLGTKVDVGSVNEWQH